LGYKHGVLDTRMLSRIFVFISFSYPCVGDMGCTPSLCYSDVVRGVMNSRGILHNIALYNGVCAEARIF
jgi:hypothetical protein